MTEREQLTITLEPDLSVMIQDAVAVGDYASTNAVIQAALRDWERNRFAQSQDVASLKEDIGKGLADLSSGRSEPFDTARIVELGRRRSANRSTSA